MVSHWASCSTCVHSQIHLHCMCTIYSQSVQPFDSFPILFNWWHPTPPPKRNAPWGIGRRLVFSLCPFPDESADVNQSWCQSVQLFDSFPRLLNLWPPKIPWGIEGRIVFSLGPFPDESADLNQIWCQSVQPFYSFPKHLWPPKKPRNARGVLGCELYLAYVHSQTNPPTCTKFGANQCNCLTASKNFWIGDPLSPPIPPGVSKGDMDLAYVHSQMNPQTWTKVGANRSSRLTASQGFWMFDP